MAPTNVRTLHWVFKVSDRTEAVDFLHNVLGMHALRHEEFAEGCAAACNGPYDGRWSKASIIHPWWQGPCRLGVQAASRLLCAGLAHSPMCRG